LDTNRFSIHTVWKDLKIFEKFGTFSEHFRNIFGILKFRWSSLESLKRLFSDFVSRTGSLVQIIIAGRIPEKIDFPSALGWRFEKIGSRFLQDFCKIFARFLEDFDLF